MENNKEEMLITTSTLIDGLIMFPYPIPKEVLIYQPVRLVTKEEELKPSRRLTKVVDIKEYIIKALRYMDKEIQEAENRARKAQNELDEYKQKSWEFEEFKRFMAGKGRY